MGGEWVERHVGDHAEFGEVFLQLTHRALRQSLGVIGLLGIERFLFLRRDRKQRHRRQPKLDPGLGLLEQQIDGHARNARHRSHRLGAVLALDYEHRLDQVIHRQPVFAHQAAREIGGAHAAHAGAG